MTSNIVPFDQSSEQSPFDSIRQTDSSGSEFWGARELMDMLGFKSWQKFKDVVDIAQENVEFSVGNGLSHFLPVEVKTGGRTGVDYRLTRLACYHTVLACDSRGKPLVKQAKHYFAVKTREAETVIPAMTEELQKMTLQNKNMELQLKVLEQQQRTLSAAGLMALTAPALVEAIMLPGITIIEKVEHIDRTVIMDRSGSVVSQLDGVGITSLQKQFGFKSTKAAWAWLDSIGYGKESGHWQKEMTAIDTAKLNRSAMKDLKQKFAQHRGDRQKLLGEY